MEIKWQVMAAKCGSPNPAMDFPPMLGLVQATFSGPLVWLHKTVLLLVRDLGLRRTFGEGACDRLTIINRTFQTFSSSIPSLHSLYTSNDNLFDVNLYVHNF